MKVHELTLPLDEVSGIRMTPAEFLAKYRVYQQARAAHSQTINVPAPFPEHEVFRVAAERGEDIEIVPADPFEQHRVERNRDVVREFDDLVATLRQKRII